MGISWTIKTALTKAWRWVKTTATKVANWVAESPRTTALVGVAVGGLAIAVAPAIVTTPMLAAAGFGTLGPVAGGLAAGVQSTMGSVAAGSLFATLQSVAMGGAGAAMVAGAVQAVGAGTCVIAGAWAVKSAKETKY